MNRLRLFFSQWIRAVSIFPLSFVVLGVMTIVWMMLVYNDGNGAEHMIRIMLACGVAFPLTVIAPLYAYISNNKTAVKEILISAIGILIGFVYYMYQPDDIDNANRAVQVAMVGGIVLARAGLVFTIACAKRNNESMTRIRWKELWLAVVMGWLAWWIIWGGISACLVSLDYLFWIKIDSTAYGYVGVLSMVFIAWAIGLIHIVNQDTDDKVPLYNRSMRIFGHYIFLPLTIIYWCILISYGIKILITWVWPKGMVVYMVTWYVGFGILTWLTTYPALPDNFISKAHRGLFISFLLTSFLMIQAVRMRIEQYGLTVDRYFVCAIIAWIIIVSVLCIAFARRRFMIAISTLLILWAASIYGGKLGAVGMASSSQKSILVKALAPYSLTLPLGSWSLANVGTGENAQKIANVLYYIANEWDEETIHSLVPKSEWFKLYQASTYSKGQYIIDYVALKSEYDRYYNPLSPSETMYFSWDGYGTDRIEPVMIAWYSTLYILNTQKANSNIVTVNHSGSQFTLNLSEYGEDLYSISHTILKDQQPPVMTHDNIQYTSGSIAITTDQMKLILTDISGQKKVSWSGDVYEIQYYRGYALVK